MLAEKVTARWLEVVAELLERPDRPDFTEVVAVELLDAYAASGVGYNIRRGDEVSAVAWPRGRWPDRRGTWDVEPALRAHPLIIWFHTTGDQRAQATDLVPRSVVSPAAVDRWVELAGPYGLRHQLSLPIEVSRTTHEAFVVARHDRPFDASDVALGQQLQRLLIALAHHRGDLGRATDLHAAAAAQLTPRETVVLALVADGLTASSIGHRLGCSPRTVQKHLERVYAKLGVRDRLSAVLRARRAGILSLADR